MLGKLSLTAGSYLLNAGMVLFGETPYNDLQMAVFAGTERLTFLDIQREHGTIFELVDRAENISLRTFVGVWSLVPCSVRKFRKFLWMPSVKH